MNGKYGMISGLIAVIGLVSLVGCEEDKSFEVVKRPKLEIAHGDRNVRDGDSIALTAPGAAATEARSIKLHLRNTGIAPLEVRSIALVSSGDAAALELERSPSTDNPIVLAPTREGRVVGTYGFALKVRPIGQATQARLKVVTSPDVRGKNVHIIDIDLTPASPTLTATPNPLNFDDVKAHESRSAVVRLVNTGKEPLSIMSFEFIGDAGFAVEIEGERWTVASAAVVKRIVLANTIVIAPGRSHPVPVHFTATSDGPATALLKVMSDDPRQTEGTHVTLNANGGNGLCPTPQIQITEGAEVCPQTTLHLVGDQSVAAGGSTIASYRWEVISPEGTVADFDFGADVANPTLTANAAGKYIFKLRVEDSYGTSSGGPACPDAEAVVMVVPCNAIHVELLWDKPLAGGGWDDPCGGGCSDIDLHLLHPHAVGVDVDGDGTGDGWFDMQYDTYYANMAPDWETMGQADDPRLDLDDVDGAGPENINLDNPVAGRTYRIGAHYWEDYGGGATKATVRIYVHGELVHEAKIEGLRSCDLWEVAEISWPSGRVKPITASNGGKRVHTICAADADMALGM